MIVFTQLAKHGVAKSQDHYKTCYDYFGSYRCYINEAFTDKTHPLALLTGVKMLWGWMLPWLVPTKTVGKLLPLVSWDSLSIATEKLLNTYDFGHAFVPFNDVHFESLVNAAIFTGALDAVEKLNVVDPVDSTETVAAASAKMATGYDQ